MCLPVNVKTHPSAILRGKNSDKNGPFPSSLCLFQNLSNENQFNSHVQSNANQTHFHMKGFALGLVLKKGQKATRNGLLVSLLCINNHERSTDQEYVGCLQENINGTERETPSLAFGICEFHQSYFRRRKSVSWDVRIISAGDPWRWAFHRRKVLS